jgi:hypothetical protein
MAHFRVLAHSLVFIMFHFDDSECRAGVVIGKLHEHEYLADTHSLSEVWFRFEICYLKYSKKRL